MGWVPRVGRTKTGRRPTLIGLLPVVVGSLCVSAADGVAQGRPPGGGKPGGGSITVTAQQDLSFGVVMPGIGETVFVDDMARRAEWVIRTSGSPSVMLVLPKSLQGPQGERIPLSFSFGDAGFMEGGSLAMTLHDPESRFDVFIPADPGFGRLFLGGTALPSADQMPGDYTATITIIVTP